LPSFRYGEGWGGTLQGGGYIKENLANFSQRGESSPYKKTIWSDGGYRLDEQGNPGKRGKRLNEGNGSLLNTEANIQHLEGRPISFRSRGKRRGLQEVGSREK